jgi:hypothetical protein
METILDQIWFAENEPVGIKPMMGETMSMCCFSTGGGGGLNWACMEAIFW